MRNTWTRKGWMPERKAFREKYGRPRIDPKDAEIQRLKADLNTLRKLVEKYMVEAENDTGKDRAWRFMERSSELHEFLDSLKK